MNCTEMAHNGILSCEPYLNGSELVGRRDSDNFGVHNSEILTILTCSITENCSGMGVQLLVCLLFIVLVN
jgi:hypothetical protein